MSAKLPVDAFAAAFEISEDGKLIRKRHPRRDDFRSVREFGAALRFAGHPVGGKDGRLQFLGSAFRVIDIVRTVKTGAAHNDLKKVSLPTLKFQKPAS